MAFIHDTQPGLEVKPDLQPGLEVVPEPEAPQVVSGPISQKPWDQTSPNSPQYHQQQQQQYHQQYQATSPAHDVYDQPSPYSPYQQPPSSHLGGISDWNGTVGPSPSERAARGPTIMGVRRKKFWLIVGPLIAIFVIGVAVGLGVGLGARSSGSDDSSRFVGYPKKTFLFTPPPPPSYADPNTDRRAAEQRYTIADGRHIYSVPVEQWVAL